MRRGGDADAPHGRGTVNSGCLASPTPAPGPDQHVLVEHIAAVMSPPAAHPRIGDGVSR